MGTSEGRMGRKGRRTTDGVKVYEWKKERVWEAT